MKLLAALPLIAALAICQPASAEPWENADPAQAGWSMSDLDAAKQHFETLGSTAIMIVQDGKAIARWGDVGRKVNAASVRKSFLGALYGIAVSNGQIDLASTLSDLGVDDVPPSLTPEEKRATVRDLLMARSGVYHRAAHETAVIRRHRPERGSHAPGTFFFYNNWDFNALGTIYRKQTGDDIFQSFATRIAQPIGMEDFALGDCRYVFEKVSEHPAYTFRMSARDLARFGQLILDRGQWAGQQLVPADWITQSTITYSQSERKGIGYGYLWWTLDPARWGDSASLASGFGGQLIAVLPAKRLVVVQTVDRSENKDGVRTSRFLRLLKDIVAAAP
jgi:CubicO group peptidase (beta-lactamase class C family)